MVTEIVVFKRRFTHKPKRIDYFANNFADERAQEKINIEHKSLMKELVSELKEILKIDHPQKYKDFSITFKIDYQIQGPTSLVDREGVISIIEPLSPEEIEEFWDLTAKMF